MTGPSLSTHVLDTEIGAPAAGVRVTVQQLTPAGLVPVASAETDADGRIAELAAGLDAGLYELRFDAGGYRERRGRAAPFLHAVAIQFRASAADHHYHIPLLLAPYGATTYRGS